MRHELSLATEGPRVLREATDASFSTECEDVHRAEGEGMGLGTHPGWDHGERNASPGERNPTLAVRFVEQRGPRGVALLEVQHNSLLGVTRLLRQALFELRVQIVGQSPHETTPSMDRFRVVEFDGAAIGRRRRAELSRALTTMLRAQGAAAE